LVVGGDMVYLATDEWNLRAVERQTGQERWRYYSASKLRGAPLLVGDQLLVNRTNNILALDARTGAERGATPTGEPASYTGLSSDGRELFVGRRNGFIQVLGSHGERPWDSAPIWEATELRGQLQNAPDTFSTPPVLAGDRLIYVTTTGGVYDVSMADGSYKLLGQLAKHNGILAPPAVAGDDLYVVDQDGVLIAFDLRSGAERWRAETGGTTWSAPSVADGRVLVSVGSEKLVTALAFDAGNGRQLWKKAFDVAVNIGSSSLLHEGRFLFTANALYALDPASGKQIWVTTDRVLPLQFAIQNQRIYGVGFDARGRAIVAAWDGATGRRSLSATFELPQILQLRAAPAVGAGRLVLTLGDGMLIAFDTTSGAEVWRQAPTDEPRGAPAVYKDIILLITKHNRLIARALDDGRHRGEFTIPADTSVQDFSALAPLIHEGRLYAAFYRTAFALKLEERP
jgi:outer membrane protein assembly factor BamB